MPEAEFKRPADFAIAVPAKRPRQDAVVAVGVGGVRSRTSSLAAPIILLEGHESEVYATQFSPDGTFLASSGFERRIYLWNVYGECENFSVLSGHTGSVLELQFNLDGDRLFSCSTDKTIRMWDMDTGHVARKLVGHETFVNCISVNRRGQQIVCSGSDDGTVKVWDCRQRYETASFDNKYQATCVAFNDAADQIIAGGIDNDLKVYDVRKQQMLYRMVGHSDTPTGMELSPNGNYVLTNSMDNTLRVWDIRPYAPDRRCVKVYQGHQHNFEKNLLRASWSNDGQRVSGGSADRFVYVWDFETGKILYKLPGHNGTVNQTDFHPVENIILSASSDKRLYLGELA